MKPLQIITKKQGETKKLGELFAGEIVRRHRRQALVIGLIGDLAAGKTTFVQGMMKGFGVVGKITSPTFVLLKVYAVKKKNFSTQNIYHCDFYRLSSQKEIKGIGLREALADRKAIIIVEWADRIPQFLKKGSLVLLFKHLQKDRRAITFHRL